MNKSLYILFALIIAFSIETKAGNPDRQGEAGALQLLMNPWALSSGFHSLNTANISGIESLRLNVAGLSFINKTELNFSRGIYFSGSEIYMSGAGLAQRVGKNGVLGISIMALDFGDIPVTTVSQPEGLNATFSPLFTNLGFSYAHLFTNEESNSQISVGATARVVSESSTNVSANGLALDAGIQYRNENVKLGISLRNIGTPLRYSGEGLSLPLLSPNSKTIMTIQQRSARYELPSVLNIGLSYDVNINEQNKLTFVGNFTSNSFSRDEAGGGLEYSFMSPYGTLQVRGGYRYSLGQDASPEIEGSVYTGIAGGASIQVPTSKKNKDNKIAFDYAYRATKVYGGTHNIGVRLSL